MTPLSSKGRDQAESTAEVLRAVNPDLLLSSEYVRTLETARIIGQHVGLTPIVNGLFYEIVRPSKFFGRSTIGPETLWYELLSALHRKNPKWHYADAENFTDVSSRAKRALAYLESLEGTHHSIVVVSHTIFINIMIAYMCKNRMLDVRDLIFTFLGMERMKNAGIIHVEYTGRKGENTCAWRLVSRAENT